MTRLTNVISRGEKSWYRHHQIDDQQTIESLEALSIPFSELTNILSEKGIARYSQYQKKDETHQSYYVLTVLQSIKKEEKETDYYSREPFTFVFSKTELYTFSRTFSLNISEIKKPDITVEQLIILLLIKIYETILENLAYIRQRIKYLEDNATALRYNGPLYELLSLKKSVVHFSIILENNKKILDEFRFKNEPFLNPDKLEHFEVLSSQANVLVEEYQELLGQISDLFVSIGSNRLNQIMKTLTTLSIILTLPTIISGLWGMNVKIPWENSTHGFEILIVLNILAIVMTAFFLNKKDL